MAWARMKRGTGVAAGVFAMFEEDGGDVRMAFENAGEFGAAIAAISDDSARVSIDYLFGIMYKNTIPQDYATHTG